LFTYSSLFKSTLSIEKLDENSESSKDSSQDQKSSALPVKLFIGQIPKGYTVEQIKNLFTNCGKEHIKDVHIITDPVTGQARGK
jgi:RNA recognition motif-containing protein